MKATKVIAAAAALVALGVGLQQVQARGRYTAPEYDGPPALGVTASLVKAGGGAANFSTATALTSMVGSKLVGAEMAKLTRQYGKSKVASHVQVSDFSVKDALRIATKAGVKLPMATLLGKKLAVALVTAGLQPDNTFNVELMLDHAVTHKIHEQVMDDIDKKFGGAADANYHKIANQAFYDLAHALGAKQVKLNKFH